MFFTRRKKDKQVSHEKKEVKNLSDCRSCGHANDKNALAENLFVCLSCGYHFRIPPRVRIEMTADPGSFTETHGKLASGNPIEMEGYESLLSAAQQKSDLREAVVTGSCRLKEVPVVLGVMDFQFMGGSMGSVVGEKITRAILQGAKEGQPIVLFTASGGARMQEGILSLMQMAKTANATALLEAARVPLFVVLTDPTMGGVTASFAMLGDVTLAEPGALIGFAGPRVIEGTIRQELPKGFQRSEFQLNHGFVDAVVPRKNLRDRLAFLLTTHRGGRKRWKIL